MIAKSNAHRFLCLAKYIYHDENKPVWCVAHQTALLQHCSCVKQDSRYVHYIR